MTTRKDIRNGIRRPDSTRSENIKVQIKSQPIPSRSKIFTPREWCLTVSLCIFALATVGLGVATYVYEEATCESAAIKEPSTDMGPMDATDMAPMDDPNWYSVESGDCQINAMADDDNTLSMRFTSFRQIIFTDPPDVRIAAPKASIVLDRDPSRPLVVSINMMHAGLVQNVTVIEDNDIGGGEQGPNPTIVDIVVKGKTLVPWSQPICKCIPSIPLLEDIVAATHPSNPNRQYDNVTTVQAFIDWYNLPMNRQCGAHDIRLDEIACRDARAKSIPMPDYCHQPFCYVDPTCDSSAFASEFSTEENPIYFSYDVCAKTRPNNYWMTQRPRRCFLFDSTPNVNGMGKGSCLLREGKIEFDSADDMVFYKASNRTVNAVKLDTLEPFVGKHIALHNHGQDFATATITAIEPKKIDADLIYSTRANLWNTPFGKARMVVEQCNVAIDDYFEQCGEKEANCVDWSTCEQPKSYEQLISQKDPSTDPPPTCRVFGVESEPPKYGASSEKVQFKSIGMVKLSGNLPTPNCKNGINMCEVSTRIRHNSSPKWRCQHGTYRYECEKSTVPTTQSPPPPPPSPLPPPPPPLPPPSPSPGSCMSPLPEHVDADTPCEAHQKQIGSTLYSLVFSDEFKDTTRDFSEGKDAKWDAQDEIHPYWQSNVQRYMKKNVVLEDQHLKIKMNKLPNNPANCSTSPEDGDYPCNGQPQVESGMMTTWNKACFAGGGYVEFDVTLPGLGRPQIQNDPTQWGYWIGLWMLGNLGRVNYRGSIDGNWPYSYQDAAACTEAVNAGRRDGYVDDLAAQRYPPCYDPRGMSEWHGVQLNQGRGAPELDVAETWGGKTRTFASQSVQIAPASPFCHSTCLACLGDNAPTLGQTCKECNKVTNASITHHNPWNGCVETGGDGWQQAVSYDHDLPSTAYTDHIVFGMEWNGGTQDDAAFVQYYVDGKKSWRMPWDSLRGVANSVGDRDVPQEPLYLIMNFAVSGQWTPEAFECNGLSAAAGCRIKHAMKDAELDVYNVRVYQTPNSQQVTDCSPANFPTKQLIEADPWNQYTDKWLTGLPNIEIQITVGQKKITDWGINVLLRAWIDSGDNGWSTEPPDATGQSRLCHFDSNQCTVHHRRLNLEETALMSPGSTWEYRWVIEYADKSGVVHRAVEDLSTATWTNPAWDDSYGSSVQACPTPNVIGLPSWSPRANFPTSVIAAYNARLTDVVYSDSENKNVQNRLFTQPSQNRQGQFSHQVISLDKFQSCPGYEDNGTGAQIMMGLPETTDRWTA